MIFEFVELRNSFAVSDSLLASMPFITTSQPALAKDKAHAFPSPLLEPHTIAFLPEIPKSIEKFQPLRHDTHCAKDEGVLQVPSSENSFFDFLAEESYNRKKDLRNFL